MTWQKDRDKGFEDQFAHKEEVSFKAAAHRNRLLAQWAAEKMQLRHKEAETYIASLVTGDVTHLRGRAIIEKIAADMKAANVPVTHAQVSGAFDVFDAQSNKEHKSD